jgi:hypothetical protein
MASRPLTLAEVHQIFAGKMEGDIYERLLAAGDQIPPADQELLKKRPVEATALLRILSTLKHKLDKGLEGTGWPPKDPSGKVVKPPTPPPRTTDNRMVGSPEEGGRYRRRRRGGADREAAAFWADMDARQPVPPPRQPKDRRGLPPKHPGFGKQTRRDVSRGIAHKGRGRKSLKKRR